MKTLSTLQQRESQSLPQTGSRHAKKRKPPTRAVTIDEVASHAGVSIKTVSRVMNREAAVRDSTRHRVLAAAKELNYKPTPAARSLASNRSYFVAMAKSIVSTLISVMRDE